jgi:PadR family transcriptional regulator PadR
MDKDTSDLLRGTLTTLVLSVLGREPLYGYEIAKEIRERTGGLLHLKEGSLYPSLHWMEREGFLSPKWVDAERGPRRKYYHLTRKGRTVLAKRRSKWQQFRDAVDTIVTAQPEGRQAR